MYLPLVVILNWPEDFNAGIGLCAVLHFTYMYVSSTFYMPFFLDYDQHILQQLIIIAWGVKCVNKFPVSWFRCKTCGDQDWLKFDQTCFVRICERVSNMIELFNVDDSCTKTGLFFCCCPFLWYSNFPLTWFINETIEHFHISSVSHILDLSDKASVLLNLRDVFNS